MSTSVESRAIAKLSWEAAWERLGNALHSPPGYPESTPEQLRECFSIMRSKPWKRSGLRMTSAPS